ncbi:hypothetical protein OIU84_027089 [Salix udensis]|uniref:Bulb-type lectin domain-containing protein n=1 Tax=Salix udensis TaxID=889485 RepID=A0AAD6KEM1_9ROSI|nr:hypothetical protein OIU84_027089 [Salix udensis]
MPPTQAKPGHLQITLSFCALLWVDPTSYVISISTATGVPIWTTVNRTTSAAVVDSGGVFQFLSNGNLRLVNGSGATVWTSNTAKLGVTSASLDDTGNLVLAANTFAVWSSFENPTDTLVPSQNLTVNQTLRSGVYSFQLRSDGNITLTWNDSMLVRGRSENVAYANDYDVGADVVRFMRLSSDGNLRMYSGGTTAMTWAALADQCQVYGYCGNMGICSYMESSSSPICKCPSLNFEAVDVNDRRKGCKRKVEVENCAGNVAMLELKQTKFFTFPGYSKFGYQGPVLLSTSFLKVCGPVQPNPSPLEQSGGDKKCWKLRVWAGGVVATISVMAASSGLFWWFLPRLSDQVVDMEEVTRAVQEHPSRRPTMGKVVQMLEGIVEIGMPPPLKANLALIPPPSSSSSSSFQTEAIPPFISERIMEKQSSSLLQPFQIKSL